MRNKWIIITILVSVWLPVAMCVEGSGVAITVTVNQGGTTDKKMVDGGGIAMSSPTDAFGVSFTLYAGFLKGDPRPTGELKYLDRQTRDLYKSIFINSLDISGNEAVIKGECTRNDLFGYTFELRLTDTLPDILSIEIRDRNGILVHAFAGGLTAGDVKMY